MFKTKPYAAFVLLFLVNFVFAQQEYTINWKTPHLQLVGDNERLALNFDGAIYGENELGLPELSIYLPQTHVLTVELINSKYISLDDFEKKLLPSNLQLPTNTVSSTVAYDQLGANTYINILPFRKTENGELEKLIAFDLKLATKTEKKVTRVANKTQVIANSAFTNGEWYKLQITEDGIYKIDKQFLESVGINTSNIDPRKIKIYGNGGGMLPQKNSAQRYDDIQENAIWVIGEEDGRFDNNDYILFYGKGQHVVNYNSLSKKLTHTKNIYSDASYYFINLSNENGKRITSVNSEPNAITTYDYYDDYIYHELDQTNYIISGREWLGEEFNITSRSKSFSFNTQGAYPNTMVSVSSSIYNTSKGIIKFNISLDGSKDSTVSISAATSQDYGRKAIEGISTLDLTSNSISNNELTVTYSVTSGISGYKAFLNKIGVNLQRILQPYDNQTFFQVISSTNQSTSGYTIGNTSSNYYVFDISDPINIKSVNYQLSGSTILFNATSTNLKRYVLAHKFNGLKKPVFIEKTENQNLHGNASEVPSLIIITPPSLEQKANEYAQMKRETIGIDVSVANTNKIYNEFSSGAQDITAIRDYIRMLYLSDSTKLKYVLLFGDASYDYKNRIAGNTNLVPTYEAPESFHNVNTYASDDFYGFMNSNEGEWNTSSDHLLDLSIGRFPINTTSEADLLIKKVTQYTNNQSSLGKWRNQVVFVADDDDNSLHMEQADELATFIDTTFITYNPNKVFLDAFEQLATPSGEISPSCSNKLNDKIEKGALIVNYTGHGNEVKWTSESIISTAEIKRLKNFEKLSLFITATCEFGRYDNPEFKSGAEELLLNPLGGAIVLLTTARPVYAQSNFKLNTRFYNEVFTSNRTIGEVMKATKNKSIEGTRNRSFTLLGDPSMTLAYPKQKILLDSIITNSDTSFLQGDTLWWTKNDQIITIYDTIVQLDSNKTISTPIQRDSSTYNFPLKALNLVTLKGKVLDQNNAFNSNFNGEVFITVFDKESRIRTLGNEGPNFEFLSRENILYEGKASVNKGRFSISFIIPKDISYQIDVGKISLYAKDDNNTLLDATGGDINIVIGGTSSNYIPDETPPQIELFMDDFSFQNGDAVSSSPVLLAKIYDENGINISTAGLGHEIVATIDGDEVNSFILNEFYSSNLNDYKNGMVIYPYKDLEEGEHTLTLRAWDTHNNVSYATINFVVDYNQATLYSYPNPMTNLTQFVIEHSREGQDVDLIIDIIAPNGEVAYHMEEPIKNSQLIFEGPTWNGENDYNLKLSAGIYFCRLVLRYADGSSVLAKVHRLVLID